MSTTTLFRPTGELEWLLIVESGFKAYPPRLDWQPIFYIVCEEDYAAKIARDWNTKDEKNGSVGYVTRCEVDNSFLDNYEVHEVGGRACTEYWIPAEELEKFNHAIVGAIEVIQEFRGPE